MTDAPASGRGTAVAEEEALLRARKRDLYAAMRTLSRDREEGTIDDQAYSRAVDRYEREAAGILERLDAVGTAQPRRIGGRPISLPAVVLALGLVAAAVTLFLLAALHDRGTGTITGSQPPPAATPAPVATAVPAPVAAARRAEQLHPRSVSAWVALGNAYLDTGNAPDADRAFRAAGRLGPGRPEAATLDALALAAAGKITSALRLLTTVERTHPAYARAWLTDGLIASRLAPGIPRAIRVWKRFLVLQPHSAISAEVRMSLRKLEAAQRGGR